MKYLIAGLGNIGAEYADTRHNIGFAVADKLAADLEGNFKTERHGFVAECKHKGRILILLKPGTYMNLSGKAVNYWLQQEKIPIENLLVITDDIALPFGKIRLKAGGSSGGHNGFKSIDEHLGTNQYARLRFGVGNNFAKGFQADYVLSKWDKEELLNIEERIKIAADAAKAFTNVGLQLTMTGFNNK